MKIKNAEWRKQMQIKIDYNNMMADYIGEEQGFTTKDFSDSDFDAYRNHKIGFVFQNYNLIPHQSILKNVELALSISGISKKERRNKFKSGQIQLKTS